MDSCLLATKEQYKTQFRVEETLLYWPYDYEEVVIAIIRRKQNNPIFFTYITGDFSPCRLIFV